MTYKYYYDKVGNITGIDKGSAVYRTYTYDKKNQLLSEVNKTNNVTTNFTYDAIGNIATKTLSGAENKTITYNYGKDADAGWNNLLTGITTKLPDGTTTTQTIDYDEIGNPTAYLGASLSWYGRQLKNYTKGSTSVSYTYDADGLRGSKIVTENKVDTKHTYHYVSGQLRYEERGNLKFYYFYDASGNLSAIRYCDESGVAHAYFALTNAQGDVVAFYTGAGRCVVTYEYDAWGNVVKQTDDTEINFAELNPIRYRGYYYDTETGLYYLQSRYYNPQVGRFLNGDIQLSLSVGVLGANVFAYCINNPVNKIDFGGNKPGDLFDSIDEAAKDAAIYLGTLSFENGWEYATSIYSVKKWQTTYETVTKTHKFLWWSWTTTSTKKRVSLVTKYTYSICSTIEDPLKVIVPDAPKFKKRVATVHTHPMGSGIGITQFSQADKDRAVDRGVPNYVYGPNGELRKYDPVTGNDILLFNDLPVSTKEPWLD